MQFDSVGCTGSNTSFDGEVPGEMESPCKKTQVSITSLDVATNPLETNMQFGSVGCSLSNTSCDAEVPDEMESSYKKTQVSITSLGVVTNPSKTNMQLESVGCMLSNTSCDGEVPVIPVVMVCSEIMLMSHTRTMRIYLCGSQVPLAILG